MTPAEQISWTIETLAATLALPGWPHSRRADLAALVAQLTAQWQQYQAGTLAATDETTEI